MKRYLNVKNLGCWTLILPAFQLCIISPLVILYFPAILWGRRSTIFQLLGPPRISSAGRSRKKVPVICLFELVATLRMAKVSASLKSHITLSCVISLDTRCVPAFRLLTPTYTDKA